MDQVQFIDGVYDEERRLIQEAERQNRLVLFVGAGASIPSGMPSWGEAVAEIKQRLNGISEQDDSLKIPQYYYAEYGKQSYTHLMRKIFKYDENLLPSVIHQKIFQFQTSKIITTNYDDLIEKAASDMFRVVDVVSQDKDLAYGIADTLIIKMHGDFAHDNFVLKEGDYLKYSDNFRLIETYLKSLIAQNVLLFIGYSFNDPDLKHIFSWVREILGEDMPNSYILIADKPYSHMDESYYRKFGIVTLYATQIIEKCKELTKESQIINMIDFLTQKESMSNIQEIHKYLLPLQQMNYVYKRYIENIFSKFSIRIEGNILVAIEKPGNEILDWIALSSADDKETLQKRGYKISEDEINQCKDISIVIAKSFVDELRYRIRVDDKDVEKKYILPKNKEDISVKFIDSIVQYDVETLEQDHERINRHLYEDEPLNLLKQATVLYHLGKYVESFFCLERAGVLFYKKRMFTWFFIALLNQKHLSRLINYRLLSEYSEEEKERIREKANKIDLEKTFQSLPDLGNEHNMFLKELYTFQIFYLFSQKMYRMTQKVQREATTVYNLYIGTPEFLKLRLEVKDFWLYITKNHILLDYYNEYTEIFKNYARTMLTTVTESGHQTEGCKGLFGRKGNIQPSELDYMDIFYILQYLPLEDMKRIVSHAERQTIIFNEDAKKYLETVFKNMKNLDIIKQEEVFGKALYLFNHIELTETLIETVLKQLPNYTHWRDFRIYGDEISYCLYYVFTQKDNINKTDGIAQCVYDYINYLLELIVNNKLPVDDKISMERMYLIFDNALFLYHDLANGTFQSPFLERMVQVDYLFILSIFYQYVEVGIQERIKGIANMELEINPANVRLICTLMQRKVLQSNEQMENQLIAFVQTMQDDRATHYLSQYEQVIGFVTNAWINDCFIQKERVANLIKEKDGAFYSWITDSAKYDYSKFKLEWLTWCSDSLLERIRDDGVSQVKIQEAVRKQYLEGQVDNGIMKRYFKYFAV